MLECVQSKEVGEESREQVLRGEIFWRNGGPGKILFSTTTCCEVGVSLFCQVTSSRTRRNDLRLHKGTFRLDIGKKILAEGVLH